INVWHFTTMSFPMEPHQLRDRVCRVAPIDCDKATLYAEQIDDPWFACQAFAWCAHFAPPAQFHSLIDRAFREAADSKDGYQRLAATAWPLRALLERGDYDIATAKFDAVMPLATTIKPPSSCSEACFLVFQAVAVGPPELGRKALHWLLSAPQPAE